MKTKMTLKEFKDYISQFPEGKLFQYGISEPFTWRGSYDEVGFAIDEERMTKEEILDKIQDAYRLTYRGCIGGDFYEYSDDTEVNFEEDNNKWTDGHYTIDMIAQIEKNQNLKCQEEKLVKMAFN